MMFSIKAHSFQFVQFAEFVLFVSKLLTPFEIENYHQYGYIAPIRVMPVDQALLLRARAKMDVPSKERYGTSPICSSPGWLTLFVRRK
jgi:hypothetical protein